MNSGIQKFPLLALLSVVKLTTRLAAQATVDEFSLFWRSSYGEVDDLMEGFSSFTMGLQRLIR